MPIDQPIYMDHAASTPCDPRVVGAMLPFLSSCPGNPSNRNHRFGWEAARAVEDARAQVAALLNAAPHEIIFTSGATESDNIAVKGIAHSPLPRGEGGRAKRGRVRVPPLPAGEGGLARRERVRGQSSAPSSRGHIITAATEHKAVYDPAHTLESEGFDVTYLTPGPGGAITPEMVQAALRDDTILVSVMWANNETGVISDVPAIARLCNEANVVMHTDATQWVGKMPVDASRDGFDLLSLSGHKIYGPKGVGTLYIRDTERTRDLRAQTEGGGQERGLRSGTLNVPGIVGLGVACDICREQMDDEAPRLAKLRERLESGLLERLDGVRINGAEAKRLPHITNVSFERMDGEALMMVATDVACSAASACSSMAVTPSHVLTAMGVPEQMALATLRLSLGRSTTEEDVDYAIDHIATAVSNLRALAPLLGLG